MIRAEATGRIRITKVPAGEAPLEVRQAWVGLELPSKAICGYPPVQTTRGVLSDKLAPSRYEIAVPQHEALEILAERAPEAVAWWHAHGFPERDNWFTFAREEFEVLGGVTMQKVTIYDNMETGWWEPMLTLQPH